jgi:hypothetical protein
MSKDLIVETIYRNGSACIAPKSLMQIMVLENIALRSMVKKIIVRLNKKNGG